MFKIQNFASITRNLFNKLNIRKLNSSSSFTSLKRICIILPATCWLGINLLPIDRLQIENKNAMQLVVDKVFGKADVQDVKKLISHIIIAMRDDNLDVAKVHLQAAIQICEQNNFIQYLAELYDLLSTVAIREGNTSYAEEILVRSVEKLTEVGYREEDNEIIRLQLMLSRLYQSSGNPEMAGIGFRNCIRLQESKFQNFSQINETTRVLYLSLLFWYSIFLTDEDDLSGAKTYLKKALELGKSCSSLEPAQIVVILYNLAELSFRMKEFDDAIKYLVEGLRLCMKSLSLNTALPVFMVKLGLVFLVKEMYDAAEYWCSIAHIFAKTTHNPCVENEASLCLKHLKENKKSN